MSRKHCVSAVTKAVKAVPSVQDIAVDLERGEVTVHGSLDERAVRAAITEEGYEVQAAA